MQHLEVSGAVRHTCVCVCVCVSVYIYIYIYIYVIKRLKVKPFLAVLRYAVLHISSSLCFGLQLFSELVPLIRILSS